MLSLFPPGEVTLRLDQVSLEVALIKEKQQHKLFSVTDATAVGGLVMGVASTVSVSEMLRLRSYPVPAEISEQIGQGWGAAKNEDTVQVCLRSRAKS